MAKKVNTLEKKKLESARIALENVTLQSIIKEQMEALGYDETKITEGKMLYKEVLTIWQRTQIKHQDEKIAYNLFDEKRLIVETRYRLHRKRAKVVFRKNQEALERLILTKSLKRKYVDWLQMIKTFYTGIETHPEYKKEFLEFKSTQEELQNIAELLIELEEKKAIYIKKKGESQEATQNKNKALKKLNEWMKDFYAIASIALEDNPQLLEALDKPVKSS